MDWGRSGVRANAWVMVQVWGWAKAGVRVRGWVGDHAEDGVYDLVGVYSWVMVYAKFRA